MPMGWVAAGAVAGGALNYLGAGEAADAQAAAANNASNNTMWMFNQQQQNLAPWANAGQNALLALQQGLGLVPPGGGAPAGGAPTGTNVIPWSQAGQAAQPGAVTQAPDGKFQMLQDSGDGSMMWVPMPQGWTPQASSPGPTSGSTQMVPNNLFNKPFTSADFYANVDPSYEFIKSQQLDALKNSGSVRGGTTGTGPGGAMSGNTLKALTDYATGSASQEYQNAYARWNQQINQLYSRLSAMSGTGANAAGVTAGLGMDATAGANASLLGGANARAAGIVGQTNALTGAGTSLANNYMLYQLMQQQQQQQQQQGGGAGGIWNPNSLSSGEYGGGY